MKSKKPVKTKAVVAKAAAVKTRTVPAKAMQTIAVSGAAGRLGKLLVESLLHKGFRVIAIVRNDEAEWELRKHVCNNVNEKYCKVHPDLEIVKDDLANSDTLAKKIAFASDFVHLAAKIDYSASLEEMKKANTMSTNVAADACKKIDARMIFISSTSVTRKESKEPINEDAAVNPINNYGKSKALAEAAVRESGTAHVIVR
ncbi:MAG: NAD(P)-dependent oxidoreductase, partial [Candidatus Micrarchaeia archaeon]